MIPDSAAGLIFFLLCLAPGTLWEILRARHEPAVKETTLLEASRLVLVSIFATSLAAVLVFGLALPFASQGDTDLASAVNELVADLQLFPSSAGFALLVTAVACAGVWGVSRRKWVATAAPIQPGRTWYQVFVALNPMRGTGVPPVLTVELLDGTTWRGRLASFDTDPEDTDRNLALSRPLRRKAQGCATFVHKDRTEVVLLPESQIKSIQVVYPAS